MPTEIGQNEMARVLRKTGKMILTDIITVRKFPDYVRDELKLIGIDYLCEGTQEDFKKWMTNAGLKNVEIVDLTTQIKLIWEERFQKSEDYKFSKAYYHLLNSEFGLGKNIFYIYVKGEKLY